MPSSKGVVTSIAINGHKLSFALDRKNTERFVLYAEAPNTQTIPQFELATRSWMISLLQASYNGGKDITITHDENRMVSQLELRTELKINPDVIGPVGPKIPLGVAAGKKGRGAK
jgi:hypothetical protein